ARTVVFENLKITKSDFPTLPNHGAAYAAELQTRVAADVRTIALDRLQSSLALAGIKPPTVAVQNNPPQVLVSYAPAILVPIDGTQLLWASNTTSDVLINTANDDYYALLAGRWFKAAGLSGPWTFVGSDALPPDFARIPSTSLAGAVLPTVAGTPQAQEAVI